MHSFYSIVIMLLYVAFYIWMREKFPSFIVKKFKATMLTAIFILSLLPQPLKIGTLIYNVNTFVLWMAGIEAVDAWYDYIEEKRKSKRKKRKSSRRKDNKDNNP